MNTNNPVYNDEDFQKEIAFFTKELHSFQRLTFTQSTLNMAIAKDSEVENLFKTFQSAMEDAKHTLSSIVDFHKKQLLFIINQSDFDKIMLQANAALNEAQTILTEFTKTQMVSTQSLGDAQDKLTSVYKKIAPAATKIQKSVLPNMDDTLAESVEISNKVNQLKEATKRSESKLANIPDVKLFINNGIQFLESYSKSIKNQISYLNNQNTLLEKLSDIAVTNCNSLKNQIKTSLPPVVKLKAQLDRVEKPKDDSGYSVPLSSSHGTKNELARQKSLVENSPAKVGGNTLQNPVKYQKF